jgi:UDP-N-acetylmuramate dehydrogenase
MQIHHNFSLKQLNTFGIEAYARYYAAFSSVEELRELLDERPFTGSHPAILGGGSNVLFIANPFAVLKNEVKGIDKIREDSDYVYVKAGGGENWHQLVLYCINHGWAGIENLSLIPGNVGASPMQNIGAYGVEVKDIFYSLEAFHLQEKTIVTFSVEDCDFGYRESVFKNKYRGQFAILNVTYRLSKIPHFNIAYGALEKELDRMGIKELTTKAVSRAVINIRSSKLPDPAKIGNAGSFFKNPEVSAEKYDQLKKDFPELVAYPVGKCFKLAAAWLIEQCGWKGYRQGDAGVHEKQALVLVNYGHASGEEIYALSEKIAERVLHTFGVTLEREVNVI